MSGSLAVCDYRQAGKYKDAIGGSKMAWIISLVGKNQGADGLTITIKAEDGVRSYVRKYSSQVPDAEWIKTCARKFLRDLEAQDIIINTSVEGPIDTTQVTQPPTLEELEFNNYRDKWRVFNACRIAIDAGLITADNQEYLTLATWLKTNWNKKYLPVLEQ